MTGNQPPPPEQRPDPTPRLVGFQRREIEHAAANQGITAEEYGNYKGRYPGVVQPVRSTGAILTLCILVTAIGMAITVGAVLSVMHPSHAEPWKLIAMALVIWVAAFFCWRSFRIEHRAQKLRKARGIVLQPPTAEDNERPVPWLYTLLPGGSHSPASNNDRKS